MFCAHKDLTLTVQFKLHNYTQYSPSTMVILQVQVFFKFCLKTLTKNGLSDRSEHSVYNAKVLVPTTYSVTFKLIRSMIAHRFGKYHYHSTSTPIKLFVFYTGSTHQVHTMCESRFLKNKKLSLCHGLYRPLVAKSSSNSKDVVI